MTINAHTTASLVPSWTIGDRLRKAREAAGLSQSEFAGETGISRRSISRYESSNIVPPKSMQLLWQLRTGVPSEWITTGCTPRDLNPEPTGFGSAGGVVTRLPFGLELVAA